jgi:hypothetical protein
MPIVNGMLVALYDLPLTESTMFEPVPDMDDVANVIVSGV